MRSSVVGWLRRQVGYRWYNARGVAPLFPFGHGLSYGGPYAYAGLEASPAAITFTVTNTGAAAGSEVAQLYLTFPEAAGEPPKQLKGFSKLPLAPGESRLVTFELSGRSRSVFEPYQTTQVTRLPQPARTASPEFAIGEAAGLRLRH